MFEYLFIAACVFVALVVAYFRLIDPMLFPNQGRCESLGPGAMLSDLAKAFGPPRIVTRIKGETWAYFPSHPLTAVPIKAKLRGHGSVITLRCYEDGPATWEMPHG
jgi:hypothetical protein